MSQSSQPNLKNLALLFLKLGIIGFGGPAVHIAMMEDEVVKRRRWMERSQFLDLVGATNLIPGPNSTEMAIHIGYIFAGFSGLIIAGMSFIVPAVIITGFFAWIYQTYGTLPQIAPLFYGIKPVVIAVILDALWRLGKKAIKNRQLFMISIGVSVLALLGVNEIFALLLGGLVGMLWLTRWPQSTPSLIVVGLGLSSAIQVSAETLVKPNLWQLGLFFLKVGSVLFGSGYVLVAFLEGDLVKSYHWLTQQQLLDAIAIGQFTPGPVSSTATFIGYLILGIPGAIVATIGIFLPSFLFVLALNPLIPKLRQSKWAGAFLDAVNVSAVALMAVVTFRLARVTIIAPFDAIALFIAILSTILLLGYRINSTWLILGGAVLGWLLGTLQG